MKKISDFIVSKRYWILGIMLCLTIVCMIMSQNVSVNEDMTKYLPDDSSMKIGMDIMEEEFSAIETTNGIRVMADGLNNEQKRELLTKLEELPYVDSVAHDDSEDYNKETYSLFEISTSYDYGSDEELAIENALENDFSEYNIVFRNNSSDFEGLTPTLIAIAMAILLTILFLMSESWFEPILFLLTIGIAVVINSGTNIFLGEVSDITASISAILQLVLSMDYSIILINRYRQEKAIALENTEAMASALRHSVGSIVSSSMTTVVGLLALVFMKFKIGKDLGIVLGKGVFLSMVCVITVLPCLILLSDKILAKTAKKAVHIPMGGVARFSYRFRYPLVLLFILMFFGFNALQGNTQISYNLANEDPIADIFPSDNMLVMIYDNEDEEKVANLADALENYDGVKQVLGYPNLLGKAYTSTEFSDMLGDLGSSMGVELEEETSLDPALLDLIYYHYYDGKTYPIKMEDFLTFLSEEVLNNDTFADAIEGDMRDQADRLADFADVENLTSAKSIQGLAEFFDMDEDTIKSLLLYYYTQHGGVDLGTMTLPAFASFVVDEVAADSTYSAMFDSDALAKMQQLKTFTNIYNITTPFSYTQIADLLGIDAEMVEMLFVYYYAMSDSYEPGTMTLPAFVSFLQNDVMKNPTFAAYLDQSVSSQINTLAQFTNITTLQKQYTSAELANMLGMDESMVAMLFTLHNMQDVSGKTMTLAQFMGLLNDNILSNEMYAESFDDATKAQLQSMNSMVQLAASGQTLTPAQMAGVIGMDEATVTQLYFLYLSTNDTAFQQEMASMTMELGEFVTLAKSQATEEQLTQLNQMEQIIKVSVSGEALSKEQLAGITGMGEESITAMFAAQSQISGAEVNAMTLQEFLALALSMQPDNAQLQQLNQIVSLAASGKKVDAATLAQIFGMETAQVQQLFGLNLAAQKSISLLEFTNYLVNTVMNNEAYAGNFSEEQKAQLTAMNQMIQLAASGKELDAAALAQTFGMDESMVAMLFTLHNVQDVSANTMTLAQFMGFLNDNILSNEMYAESFDDATKAQLQSMNSMVQLAASGQTLTPAQMAGVIGMDEATVTQLYFLYLSTNDTAFQQEMASMTMELGEFVTLAKSQATEEQLTQLNQMEQIIAVSVSGEALSKEQLAGITGMGEESITAMFAAQSQISGAEVNAMTLQEFLTLVLSMQPDNAQLQQLNQIVSLAASGTKVDAATLAQIFGMETTQVQQLFGLNLAAQKSISLPVFTNYLVDTVMNNEAYAGNFSDEQKAQLTMMNQMIQLAASGKGLDAAALAQTFGMDENLITMIFGLYYGGDISGKTMSMVEIVDFILENSTMSALLDSETMTQLKMMQGLMNETINGTSFSYSNLASVLGMDKSMLKILFTYHDASTEKSDGWKLSLQTVVDFLVNNKSTFASMMGSDTMSQLSMMQGLMNGTIEGTSYKPSALADLLGMDSSQIEQLYLLYISQHGDTSSWKMSVQKMVNFLNSDVLDNEEFADMLDADSKEMLTGAKTMIDAVVSGKEYTASETQRILSALTDELDENTVELLYFYYAAQQNSDSSWKLSIEQLLNHLCDSVMEDARFASFIDDEMRSQITDVQDTLNDGVGMLKSENHSRMIIYTTLPVESEETADLISWLNEQCSDFSGQINLIGNSAMSYEMQQTFDDELTMITMLTSVAIFLIVLVTFRNFLVPLLLVLVVQCGVYVTVAIIGSQGYSIYFLALLIVECILMGATIDYGILFTNYFIENCKKMETKDAIQEAYKGSIHTIMTSGLIIVLVVGIVGYTSVDPTIGQICRTIAIGALSAILLILFILPGMLAGFRRLIVRKNNSDEVKC